jgi:hypothetical protein
MEKENKGRCPVGGVPHHGGEHDNGVIDSCRASDWDWEVVEDVG